MTATKTFSSVNGISKHIMSMDFVEFMGNQPNIGTFDLACYLITTPKGNILINTGLVASEPLIKAGIEAFRL